MSTSAAMAEAGWERGYRLTAFGLDVRSQWPLPGARNDRPSRRETGRRTRVELSSTPQMDAAWSAPAERIFAPLYPDGRTRFTVDRSADHFRLWFEGFGRYLVSTDGRWIGVDAAATSRPQRERFLFAQVLPLAALLHGLEVLHASAICLDTATVAAFVGVSGAGKTSLASRFVARGAGFVADDVLALECDGDDVVVQPGPPFMAVPEADRSLIPRSRGRLGHAAGQSDKIHATPPAVGAGMRLRTVFHLETGQEFELSPLGQGDARRVLATVFAPYLMTRDRLRRHLEVTRLISANIESYRLRIPRDGDFDVVLEAVERHVRGRAG